MAATEQFSDVRLPGHSSAVSRRLAKIVYSWSEISGSGNHGAGIPEHAASYDDFSAVDLADEFDVVAGRLDSLDSRESMWVKLSLQELPAADIARRMGVSKPTLTRIRRQALDKLARGNNAQFSVSTKTADRICVPAA